MAKQNESATADWRNKLYFGDNLHILREMEGESVDLIYLDPPFKSNANYNVLFRERTGEESAAQITAFEDTWAWNMESEYAYQDVVTDGPEKLAMLLQSLRGFLGQNDMMAYLTMMAERVAELHRVLTTTGTIYLHCDPTASHYLKLLMDAVFGSVNFRNEIIWAYRGGGSPRNDFPRRHDVILRYSKGRSYTFNPDPIRIPYQAEGLGRTDDSMWGRHRGVDKVYKPNPLGKVPEDWWQINVLNANSPERLGYPTQKPEALLERIIEASSNPGDVVLDPFCGCGTAIAVAERLGRRWIGIDITHLAVSLMKSRLHDTFPTSLSEYDVIGVPQDFASAKALANESEHDGRYQFQYWALGLVNARPARGGRRGADGGVDGYIHFFDDNSGKAKRIVVQVKSGNVGRGDIATLKGDMDREDAVIGLFVTLNPPTGPMVQEAASAGVYASTPFGGSESEPLRYPRLQILTVADLLAGATVQYPWFAGDATFRQAGLRRERARQERLG